MTRTNTAHTILEDAPRMASEAGKLLAALHRLERANLIGLPLDFETRMDIAYELREALDVLNPYAQRVLG